MTRIFNRSNLLRLCLILLFLGGALVWLRGVRGYSRVSSDFSQDYFAVIAWKQGLSIFTPELERLAPSDLHLSEVGNFHPPTQTLLYLPFALLSYQAAFTIWSIISLAVYIFLIFLLARETKLPLVVRDMFLAISLCWYPFFFCTNAGQSSVLITACIIFSWLGFRKQRSYIAGAWLAGAVLFKLFPGLLVFFIILKRDWKALFSFILTIAAGVIGALLLFGYQEFSLYSSQVISVQMGRFSSFLLNCSLSGITFSLFSANPYVRELWDSKTAAEIIALLVNLCCFLYVLFKARKLIERDNHDFAFSLFCVAMLLLSPLTWMHIFILMLFPLCLLYQSQREGRIFLSRTTLLVIFLLLSLPDVSIGRFLVQSFGTNKIPVLIYLLYRVPTFALVYLGYLLGRPSTPSGKR